MAAGLLWGGTTVAAAQAKTALKRQASATPARQTPAQPRLHLPDVVLQGVPFRLRVAWPEHGMAIERRQIEVRDGRTGDRLYQGPTPHPDVGATHAESREWTLNNLVLFDTGVRWLRLCIDGGQVVQAPVRVLPSWFALLPALVAISLALLSRQILVALSAGIAVGAWLLSDFNPLAALLRLVDRFVLDAMADAEHVTILFFSLLLGGMVGIITRSGGGSALADAVTRRASTPRR
ncbi:MAG: hypothetical protein ACPGUV_07005, partial [Polyangiales bacterium]